MTYKELVKNDSWPSQDDFAKLIRVIRIGLENEYLTDDPEGPVGRAAKALIAAWDVGCVRIEQPDE